MANIPCQSLFLAVRQEEKKVLTQDLECSSSPVASKCRTFLPFDSPNHTNSQQQQQNLFPTVLG